jgi:hypothetical protein
VSKDQEKPDSVAVKLLGITQEEGSYCLSEYELPKAIFLKYCKKISRTEPDQFAILNAHLTRKARELLEI